jgi:flagellar hook-associated protein 3 FlgL
LERIASGRRFQRASDAPQDAVTIQNNRSNLARIEQTIANLGRFQAEFETGEKALQSAVGELETAIQTGANAISPSQTAESRSLFASQIEAIAESLIRLANTRSEGRYVFSGDSDGTAAYQFDPLQADPVSAYLGSTSTRQAEAASGSPFAVGIAADTIFDDPTNNVFDGLIALRDALRANDEAAIGLALESVKAGHGHVNSKLSEFGRQQARVWQEQSSAQSLRITVESQLSQFVDADPFEEATRLTAAENQIEASLTALGRLPRGSLFDYLG